MFTWSFLGEIAVCTNVSWFLNMWQKQVLHNFGVGLSFGNRTEQEELVRAVGETPTLVCSTVLPPGAVKWAIWEEGSAPRPDKAVTTTKKSFIHICGRLFHSHALGTHNLTAKEGDRLKWFPCIHGRENQVWWWGKTFSREHCEEPWQGIFFMARALGQGIYYITREILWFWVSLFREKEVRTLCSNNC